jgi:hypothetical protein
MTDSFEDDRARATGRRGFSLLSLAAGVVLAMLLVALGTRDIGATAEPSGIDSPPAMLPGATEPGGATVAARHAARLDDGVDWQRVEVWTEFGPAAVAAYER